MSHQFIGPYGEVALSRKDARELLLCEPAYAGPFVMLPKGVDFVDRDMFGQVIGYGKAPACEYCATCYRGNENRCDSCGAPRKLPKPNKDWITTCPTS